MAANYTHTTRSSGTVLTDTIYNADHNNHITNMIPTIIDDFSVNDAQMQTVRDPYPGAAISLASSLSEELSSIRFMIKQITGQAQWYIDAPTFIDVSGFTMTGNIVMGDNSVTGIDTLTFTDTAGTIAGIQNQNLVDKSATETIAGVWALGTPSALVGTNISGTAAGLTAGAVSTITGLAPDTATTQAAQANITSLGTLTSLVVSGEITCADNLLTKPMLKDYSELTVTNAAAGATETLDIEAGNVFHMTLDENITFTFSNPIASDDMTSFTLILTQDGSGTNVVTWPASVDWEDGSAPTLVTTAASVSILGFYTIDGGTIWHGVLGSSDSK